MKNIITADSKEGSVLRRQCYPVQVPGEAVTAGTIISSLKEVVDNDKNAAGIAAPQLGFNKRIAVVSKNIMRSKEHFVIINPELKAIGPDTTTESESCLSFPGLSKKVKRYKNITISTLSNLSSNDRVTVKLTGYPARVVQHEVDHLNGITLIDK